MSAGKRFFGYLAVFSKHSEKYTPLSLLRVFKKYHKIRNIRFIFREIVC